MDYLAFVEMNNWIWGKRRVSHYKKIWDKIAPSENYFFIPSEEGDYKSIDGVSLKKVEGTRKDSTTYPNTYEADFSGLDRFKLETSHRLDINQTKFYLDIEVLTRNISELKDYSKEIISVALSTSNHHYKVLIHDLGIDFEIPNCRIIKVDTEEVLIRTLIKYIKFFDPEILTGWFSSIFDLPYLAKRAEKYGINFGSSISPFHKGYLSSRGLKSLGRELIDLKDVYLSVFVQRARFGLKLDSLAKHHLNSSKYKLGKSIWDAYNSSKNEILIYNLQDLKILEDLDRELDLYNNILLRKESLDYAVSVSDLLRIAKLSENATIKEFWHRNLRVPSKLPLNSDSSFSGATVLDTKPGIYSKSAIFDVKGMYSSIVITKNISPELGQFSSDQRQVKSLGCLPSIMKRLMSITATYKSLPETDENRLKLLGVKGIILSAWGTLLDSRNRFYSPLLGDEILSWGRDYLNSMATGLRNLGAKIVAGDTDSCFITGLQDYKETQSLLNRIIAPLEVGVSYYDKLVIFPQKKKWVGLKEDGSLTIRGLVSIRKDMPNLLREFFISALLLLLKEKITDYKKMKDQVRHLDFKNQSLLEIAEKKFLTKLTYSSDPIHFKAARYAEKVSNYSYSKGDQIYFLYLKNRESEVIAISEDNEDYIRENFVIDWKRLVNKWFLEPLKGIEELSGLLQPPLFDFFKIDLRYDDK